MTDPLYGPVDDDTYRAIARSAGSENARFLYDLTIVAVNYDEKPHQMDHLVHKWGLTGSELESALAFVRDFGVNGS